MEIVLIWILSSVLTWLSGKLKVSKTYVSIWLCILLGTGYYFLTNYYGWERQKLVEIVWGVYASSQLVYNILKKFWLLEKIDEKLL